MARRSRRIVVESEEEEEEPEEELVEDEMEEEEEEEERPRSRGSRSRRGRVIQSQASQSSRQSSQSSSKKRLSSDALVDSDVEEDEEEEAKEGGFILHSQLEATQELPEGKDSEYSNLNNLSKEKREKALRDLTRVVLFKAMAHQPIDRLQCIKDAGLGGDKIATAAFAEVKARLENIFGFTLVRIPAWMEYMKDLPSKYKDRYYLTNTLDEPDDEKLMQNHHQTLHSVHVASSIEKSLLMTILAIAYCKGDPRSDGSRWLHDKDLYSLLHKLDDNIPEEPPSSGFRKKRKGTQSSQNYEGDGVGSTPNVDILLDKFEKMEYLLKQKPTEQQMQNSLVEPDSFVYAMGPRAAVEIGRKQVIYFCANVLGVEPDKSMISELDDDELDDGEQMEE